MAGPEILDRSPFVILLDDRRRDVRRTTDRRCISELRRDPAHHGGEGAVRVGLRLREAVTAGALGERDRGGLRPALSWPVACSFVPRRGEIETSPHAGGIASFSIRSICTGSAISRPRES